MTRMIPAPDPQEGTTPGSAASAGPRPLITVVTVCRNAAATLERCIESVAAQTYPRIEYIVVDGASTDGTPEILARHAGRIDVLVREPDSGIYDAMNKGIAKARGDFLLFLNADDRFVGPNALSGAVEAMARVPEADIYYGAIEVRGRGFTTRHDPPPETGAAEEMVLGCLPHQATLARRTVFERTGPFDLRWRRHADYAWWMKALADPALRVRRIDALIASFALGGASHDLEKGQPEVFAIQNAADLYRSAAWDRRRREMFRDACQAMQSELARLGGTPAPLPAPDAAIEEHQQAWLDARIALGRLQESRAGSLRGWVDAQLRRVWSLLVRVLPAPVLNTVRMAAGRPSR